MRCCLQSKKTAKTVHGSGAHLTGWSDPSTNYLTDKTNQPIKLSQYCF